MPSFGFSPGRFSPVVEVVSPDTCHDFYDETVSCEFEPPSFDIGGRSQVVLISTEVPNCFENSVLDSTVPAFREPDTELLFSSGSIISVQSSDLYGCACVLNEFSIACIPVDRTTVHKLTNHNCQDCVMCGSVRSNWFNGRVWFGTIKGGTRPALWSLKPGLLPVHPKFKGMRFILPYNLHSPWSDCYVEEARPGLGFPRLNRDWLHRRQRYRDWPS